MSLVRAEQAFWSGYDESLKAFSICLLTPGEGSNLGCPLYQAMNLMATCLPPARALEHTALLTFSSWMI
jgi:hypothetical protein